MITEEIRDNVTNQAYKFAAKLGLSHADTQDLQQEALAVVCTLEDTEQDRAKFETYCYATALRTMQNWMQERQYSVIPVSRHYGEQLRRAVATASRLQQELGRLPRNREIAEAMDITLEQYENLRTASEYVAEDTAIEGDPFSDVDYVDFEGTLDGSGVLPGPEFVTELSEVSTILAKELGSLLPQEAEVIDRLYLQSQTLREAGDAMELSFKHVARLRDRGLAKLRNRLPREFGDIETLSLEGRSTA